MDPIAPRLPVTLGSLAALVVAYISFLSPVTTATTVMRTAAAYVVFAAFGVVIRYLLGDAAEQTSGAAGIRAPMSNSYGVDEITPGTSIEELLGSEEPLAVGETARSSVE